MRLAADWLFVQRNNSEEFMSAYLKSRCLISGMHLAQTVQLRFATGRIGVVGINPPNGKILHAETSRSGLRVTESRKWVSTRRAGSGAEAGVHAGPCIAFIARLRHDRRASKLAG